MDERAPLLQVILELPRAAGVAELAQRFRLDLADPLACDVELLAHLLEGPRPPVLQPEAELKHAPFASGERVEDRLDLLLQQLMRGGLSRGQGAPVLDEVAEVRVLLLADRRLERDRLLGDLDDLADLLGRDDDLLALRHRLGDLVDRGLTAELLEKLPRHPDEPVDRLDHVRGDADGASLVGDGAGDGLTDPPRGVGGELVTLLVVELLDRPDEPDVALLDEVEEAHPAADVLLGDRHDEAQVGGGELLARVPSDAHEVASAMGQLRVRGHGGIPAHPLEQFGFGAGLWDGVDGAVLPALVDPGTQVAPGGLTAPVVEGTEPDVVAGLEISGMDGAPREVDQLRVGGGEVARRLGRGGLGRRWSGLASAG